MIISDKYIFFHIPKSSGTTLRHVFLNNDKKWKPTFTSGKNNPLKKRYDRAHLPYLVVKNHTKIPLDQLFKCCFVRNPYDRIISTYYYFKTVRKEWSSFKLFFDKYLTEKYLNNYLKYVHLMPMYRFVVNEEGKNMMDFVGKVENYDEDLNKLANILDIPLNKDVKSINVHLRRAKSPRAEGLVLSEIHRYSYIYSREYIERINQLYDQDFSYFSYDKLNPNDYPPLESVLSVIDE